MGEILRAVSGDDFVKLMAISARDIVERAREIHDASPVAAAALGRTLCATAMLGAMQKEDDASVTVRINGGGPLGSILAVADSGGNVRGYVQHPQIQLPKRADGKLDVGTAVGRDGMLSVTRDLGFGEPYVGSTQLRSGELGEDFSAFLVESDQVGSACGLGVLVDTDQSIRCAGGFIVQLLPGAPENLIDAVEANIAAMGPVTQVLEEADGNAEALVSAILAGLQPRILERQTAVYRCSCSRERVLRAVTSISPEDLAEIQAAGEDIEVRCQFCDAVYTFSPGELSAAQEQTPEEEN